MNPEPEILENCCIDVLLFDLLSSFTPKEPAWKVTSLEIKIKSRPCGYSGVFMVIFQANMPMSLLPSGRSVLSWPPSPDLGTASPHITTKAEGWMTKASAVGWRKGTCCEQFWTSSCSCVGGCEGKQEKEEKEEGDEKEEKEEEEEEEEEGGSPFWVNIHVMSFGSPGTLAKAINSS